MRLAIPLLKPDGTRAEARYYQTRARRDAPGPYQVQAAIAALHEAMHNKVESVKEDDWELHRHGGGDAVGLRQQAQANRFDKEEHS